MLAVQEHPGDYFTVVQIGVNTVAILAGIVGEGAFTPHFERALRRRPAELAATLGFAASFISITSLFIVMADLVPKRLSMNEPERVAMRLVGPMLLLEPLLQAAGLVLQQHHRRVDPPAGPAGSATRPSARPTSWP